MVHPSETELQVIKTVAQVSQSSDIPLPSARVDPPSDLIHLVSDPWILWTERLWPRPVTTRNNKQSVNGRQPRPTPASMYVPSWKSWRWQDNSSEPLSPCQWGSRWVGNYNYGVREHAHS